MKHETARFTMYFKIPFSKYWIGRDMWTREWHLMYYIYDSMWGSKRWKIKGRV